MKIAFSVTIPDLARVLSHLAARVEGGATAVPATRPPRQTVSPAAREALAGREGAGDGQ